MSKAEAAVSAGLIAKDLRQLGLGKGAAVLVHSNLRALAPARELVTLSNCGSDVVIDGFLEAVGPPGLVAVPTLTDTFAKREPGRQGLAFDPAETPSRVGSITNVLWRRPGAKRSKHPTHSLAAIGKRAEEFVADHGKGSTFDMRSPYRCLYDWDGQICFFGTDMRTCTMLHAVEDWMDLPYMMEAQALVKGSDGKPQEVTVTKSPGGARDFYRRGSKVEQYLESKGFIRKGKVASATVQLMSVRQLVDYTWQGIIEDPCLLMRTDSEADDWSKQMCEATIKYVRERFGS
jgi:aminoglycoside 3-N-acetyltransferase